ncbi:MAG: PAAR domain-containing protein [Sideroxyarcus sp.]|nr:PAAR domain-containing protein [Sideroxyarcus sp.]
MKRHHITLGAKTTAGGIVATATSFCTIEGAQMALDGDTIACPSCKSTGKIRCIGPRIPETWNGRDAALENDLCMCKCAPPPRLLAAQSLRYQEIDGVDNWWTSPSNLAPAELGEAFDQRILMSDSLTGVPLACQPYRLQNYAP